MDCKCGHSKHEHIKYYETDLKKYEIQGEPYNCLVSDCPCSEFVHNANSEDKG